MREGMKNTQFSANKSPYLRNGQDRTELLLLMTHRKLHMRFR